MSWHYLQGQGVESSEACCSDGEPCAQLRSKTTHAEFYCNGKLTESYLDSLSGMMSAPSTENHGKGKSMSSPEDSRARTSPAPEKEKESAVNDPVYGGKCTELLVKYDPDTSLWKTAQCSLFEDSPAFLGRFPNWGMMLGGELYQQPMPELHTSERESGSLPTPSANEPGYQTANHPPVDKDGNPVKGPDQRWYDPETGRLVQKGLTQVAQMWPTPQANKMTKSGEIVNQDGTPWDGISKPHSSKTGKPITTALSDAVMFWPTPHGFTKDGKTNGPSGNELGRAVNQSMWPTPATRDYRSPNKKSYKERGGGKKGEQLPNAIGGSLNPPWVEWLMGWPIGWTDLKPLETDKSLKPWPWPGDF